MTRKILVTGGAGFIGSHTSKQLIDQGHQVVVYDNLSRGHQESLDPRVTFIKGDLSDQTLLSHSLKGVDLVIHMASLMEVSESVKYPLEFVENNVLGATHLLEAMRKSNVKKILFSSSACVYGDTKELPLTETAPVLAANPYGATKVAIENLLSAYYRVHNFDVTILRYFNPYGPGEFHQPESHAIPNFIKSALKKEPIPLYWRGEPIRDFIYIDDLVLAHTAVLDMKGWNVFNVGTETGVKIKDVLGIISEILGYSLEIDDLGERPGDVMASFASSKLLKETTGWEAKYSLKEGLEKTINYYQDLKPNS